jgi:hypothetical protein
VFSVTVVEPPEVQTDLDSDEWVYDFVRFLALIMNLTLDFSVDAHTERKLNDKFELKNSKTQNNVWKRKISQWKASEHKIMMNGVGNYLNRLLKRCTQFSHFWAFELRISLDFFAFWSFDDVVWSTGVIWWRFEEGISWFCWGLSEIGFWEKWEKWEKKFVLLLLFDDEFRPPSF